MSGSLEGALVIGTSEEARSKVYFVENGEKFWVMSPAVFLERGWKFEDVIILSDQELDAIPTSADVIGGEQLLFVPRDNARKRVSERFLSGEGMELGAGMYPQPLPGGAHAELFELRGPAEVARLFGSREEDVPSFGGLEEIRSRFPDGADFLIAHNVLEHCADPIATLLEWTSYVRNEGILVLSVPCVDFCADKGRLVPDVEHLIFDYLLARGPDHFESREHAYSCAAGWMNTWEDWLSLGKQDVAKGMHAKAHQEDLDVHWHAFTPPLFDRLVEAASHFGERRLHPMAWADPYLEGDAKTVGDIIGVLRVGGEVRKGDLAWREGDVAKAIRQIERALVQALDQIRSC